MSSQISSNFKLSNKFIINGSLLDFLVRDFPFKINSFPKKYTVSTLDSIKDYESILSSADFIIIDEKVAKLYPFKDRDSNLIFYIDAKEDNKNLNTVNALIDIFIERNISKGSKVIAIGGGIIQDIAACACALFRRGLPFIYMPTTTLGQLDSCIGAKCAVNTKSAKNILGLFSAPSEVVIPKFIIKSMPLIDHRAGLSEMLRLCITASEDAVDKYIELLPEIINPETLNLDYYEIALKISLSIKKSVVDFDEYETDVRRSMNYGHTFGHAIEKLVNFKLPHGLAILVGMHIANTFSFQNGSMNELAFNKISRAIKSTISGTSINLSFLKEIKPEEIIIQFKYDKKGDGKSVPLILINQPGEVIFHKYFFNSQNNKIIEAIVFGINNFVEWSII